jgi:uncharacterized protein YndB with AHSA1/START domain
MLVVTRTVKGPARVVFEAWTKAELLQQLVVAEVVPDFSAFLRWHSG